MRDMRGMGLRKVNDTPEVKMDCSNFRYSDMFNRDIEAGIYFTKL